MSNKSRLQTNNTNLQSLIDKANNLPDAGGGGGANIETCDLTVSADGKMHDLGIIFTATAYENGTFVEKTYSIYLGDSYDPKTLTNIVKKTPITVSHSYYPLAGVNASGVTILNGYSGQYYVYIYAINEDSTEASLHFYDDD